MFIAESVTATIDLTPLLTRMYALEIGADVLESQPRRFEFAACVEFGLTM